MESNVNVLKLIKKFDLNRNDEQRNEEQQIVKLLSVISNLSHTIPIKEWTKSFQIDPKPSPQNLLSSLTDCTHSYQQLHSQFIRISPSNFGSSTPRHAGGLHIRSIGRRGKICHRTSEGGRRLNARRLQQKHDLRPPHPVQGDLRVVVG